MTVIRMRRHMTGGRHDGQEWPPYMGLIDVPEWEAKELVASENAEWPDDPELDRGYDVLKIAATDYEKHLKGPDGEDPDVDPRYAHHTEDVQDLVHDDFDIDFERDDSDSDFSREPEEKLPRPKQADNKQAWVDYVVNRGYISYGDAKNLTKNALMEMDD